MDRARIIDIEDIAESSGRSSRVGLVSVYVRNVRIPSVLRRLSDGAHVLQQQHCLCVVWDQSAVRDCLRRITKRSRIARRNSVEEYLSSFGGDFVE